MENMIIVIQQLTRHLICWCCRLKLQRTYTSGRLHWRKLWKKHQVLPTGRSKMVSLGTIKLIQLKFLWTSVCSCYNCVLQMSLYLTVWT